MNKMKILHLQAAQRDRHPAVLIAMIVDRTGLAYFPADGHQLIERSAIDQIARVVLTIPGEIRIQGIDINRGSREKSAQRFWRNECRLWKQAKLFDKFLDGNRFCRS